MSGAFTERDLMTHSASAIGKLAGRADGAFRVSHIEVEAMAVLLLILGMPPLPVGEEITDPDAFFKPFTERNGVTT